MKKLLLMGALALSALALSQQQASAWINCRFGIGFNWCWQSGGNQWLWGAWCSGQPCCPDFGPGYFGPGPFCCNLGPDVGYFGGGAYAYSAPVNAAPANTTPVTPPAQHAWYYNSPNYQPVSQPGYYTIPSYYYPVSGYYSR